MLRKQEYVTKFLSNELTAEDLINIIVELESELKIYKEENDKYEQSKYIESYMYEMKVNEKGEIPCFIKVNDIEHSIGITERDAKSFERIFRMNEYR